MSVNDTMEWKPDIHKQASTNKHTDDRKWKRRRRGSQKRARERSTYLKRWNVGVGYVAVHILDLRKVLLRHVHQLRRPHLIGKPREAVFWRRGVIILISVLRLENEKAYERQRDIPQSTAACKAKTVSQWNALWDG